MEEVLVEPCVEHEIAEIKLQMARMMEILQRLETSRISEVNQQMANSAPVVTPQHPPGFTPPHSVEQPTSIHPFNGPSLSGVDPLNPPYGLPRGFVSQVHPNEADNVITSVPQGPYIVPEHAPLQFPTLVSSGLPSFHAASLPQHTLEFPWNNQNHANPFSHIQENQGCSMPKPQVYSQEVPKATALVLGESSKDFQNHSLRSIEQRLRMIEGIGDRGLKDIADMCLVPGVVIPYKFKCPEFDKYRGTSCPRNHLTMFVRKMAAYAHDDKLMIHCFQDSLAGAASNWYTHLERGSIICFRDLADAFIRQYKFNLDMAPDRVQLQSMVKGHSESFKEYAQRWRELAAQVEPPLSEKEMVSIFLNTLQTPFFEKMVGSASSNFSDLVVIGERIEVGVKSGRIIDNANSAFVKKPYFVKKKESEANFVAYSQSPSSSTVSPITLPRPEQASKPRKWIQFDAIPTTYAKLLPFLLERNLLERIPARPFQPPFPSWYDPNAYCEYHSGVPGHSVENCLTLKRKVQQLVNNNMLNFEERPPNVKTNPLPNYSGVNCLNSEDQVHEVSEIQMPLAFICEHLYKEGMISLPEKLEEDSQEAAYCEYHGKGGHLIQHCHEFQNQLQSMMNAGYVAIMRKPELDDVCAMQGTTKLQPVTIVICDGNIMAKTREATPVTFPMSSSVSPVDYHQVPWVYPTHKMTNAQTDNVKHSQKMPVSVSNIVGVGGLTRSGRVYSPPNLKVTQVEKGGNVHEPRVVNLPPQASKENVHPETGEPFNDRRRMIETEEGKREATDEEAVEFLKFIKQSEYRVVDQLNRIPARISILTLLMNSEPHREVLLKILSQAHVPQYITTDNFGDVIGHIAADNHITFSDSELPLEGCQHTKALHISVKCHDHHVARVLVDNGSSLNVMPKSILAKLPVQDVELKPSSTIVRAFDGSRREVMGEIDLPIEVGPCVFQVHFHVMDIVPAYSCLLGRPWIHSSGVVPSSLHQKLKYIVDGQTIIVNGEEDILVNRPNDTPYVEAAEEALETAFQSLEIANTSRKDKVIPKICPNLNFSPIVAKMMLQNGYKPGRGLGKYEQGMVNIIQPLDNKARSGLGFENAEASDKNWEEGSQLEDFHQVFIKSSVAFSDMVGAVNEDEAVLQIQKFVRKCDEKESLDNWRITPNHSSLFKRQM